MTQADQHRRRVTQLSDMALIYLLFFSSGISGLIYETVWLRMLIRVFGCTVYATATVLSAFMAGLGIGSYVSGRYIDRAKKPLLVYALIEGLVGIAGLAVTAAFYAFPGLYAVLDVAVHPRTVERALARDQKKRQRPG